MVTNTIDFGLSPQDSLDAPRWMWTGDKTILVEPAFPTDIAEELRRRGHDIRVCGDPGTFGRGQIIWRTDSGTLCAATESRCDGCAAVL